MNSHEDGQDEGWAAAGPEVAVGAAVAVVAVGTGYALAGLPGAAVAAAAAAFAALLVVRVIPPRSGPADPEYPYLLRRHAGTEGTTASFTGFWRRRSGLGDGLTSLPWYDAELRGTLQHLLAARLAERHGVSLLADPGSARRLLCPHPQDADLWYWVDPARPPAKVTPQTQAQQLPGIPPRTLARLIDRLERL